MSFREKIAWISALTTLAIYGWYFHAALPLLTTESGSTAPLLRIAILGLAVSQIVLIAVAAGIAPRDAKAPLDERDALIAMKGNRTGLIVMEVGAVLACVGGLHLGADSAMLANGILLTLALAQIAKQATQIIHYRRGA